MNRSRTIAAALAALTVVSVAATGAEAKGWKGAGIGFGIAAGALIAGATATAAYSAYYEPGYVVDTGYRECRYVQRVSPYGYVRTIRVCDVD